MSQNNVKINTPVYSVQSEHKYEISDGFTNHGFNTVTDIHNFLVGYYAKLENINSTLKEIVNILYNLKNRQSVKFSVIETSDSPDTISRSTSWKVINWGDIKNDRNIL